MNHSTILARLAVVATAIALASCKPDTDSGRTKKVVAAENAPKSIIARVAKNPTDISQAKIELVSSNSDLKNASATDIEAAFQNGSAMKIQSEGDMVGATDAASGQSFSLFGCQAAATPYYNQYQQMPYGQTPMPYGQTPMPYGQMPYGQAGYGGGYQQQQSGNIFQNLLGGLNIGSLFGNMLPQGGMFGSLLGAFQNITPFMQNGMMPVSLPFGQNFNQAFCNSPVMGQPVYGQPVYGQPIYGQPVYGQPYGQTGGMYPQMPGTPYTPNYGTTPYPYMGQYQQGPYNYYTYGQQPVGGQPVYNGGYPQYTYPQTQPYPNGTNPGMYNQAGGSPYTYSPGGQYTYTPYPSGVQ